MNQLRQTHTAFQTRECAAQIIASDVPRSITIKPASTSKTAALRAACNKAQEIFQ